MMADWMPTGDEVERAVEAWYAEKHFDPFAEAIDMLYARKLVEEYEKPCEDKSHRRWNGAFWDMASRKFDCPWCMEQLRKEVGLDG